MILAPVFSLNNRNMSKTWNQNSPHFKKISYINQFFHLFLFLQSQSGLWESMAAIFRQSAGYILKIYLNILMIFRSHLRSDFGHVGNCVKSE